MANRSPKLDWCIVRLGEDMNWWVEEISDDVHWDIDGLSIIDPRQMNHILDLMDPLRDYGLDTDIIDAGFFTFAIEDTPAKKKVKLRRVDETLFDVDEPIFCLPDIVNDEKGPYADFLDHITKLRVKLLNDVIEFDQKLTVDELEEAIREEQNNDFMEGRAVHAFREITDILEYVPEGFELDVAADDDESEDGDDVEIEEDFPDIDVDEKIEEDETMRWEEEEQSEPEEDEDVPARLELEELDDEDNPFLREEEDEDDGKPKAAKKKSKGKKK